MALELDGVDQAIDCGVDAVLDNLAQKTLTAWIYTHALAAQMIMSKHSFPGWRWFIEEKVSELRMLLIQNFSNTNGRWRTPNTVIISNTWQHVALTYDRTNVANDPILYIDGLVVAGLIEATTPVGTVADDSGSEMDIGKKALDPPQYFDGLLDDLRIYDRLLSAAEILTIYTARGVDGIVDGLVARWMPNELAPGATVLSVVDLTGVSDGSPENAPVYAEGVLRSRRRTA